MQFLLFQIRQLLTLLADGFLFPFKKLSELWRDPKRGRSIIFGLPALLVAFFGVAVALIAMNSQSRFLDNYEVAKAEAEKEENWPEATIYMRKIMQLRPKDDVAKWEMSELLLKDDREETAEANKRMALSIKKSLAPDDKPGFATAHVWMANLFLRKNPGSNSRSKETVKKHLDFALATDPGNADARVLMAEAILIPERRYEEALEIYQDLFQDYRDYHVKVAQLCNHLARQAKDDPEKKEKYLSEARDCLKEAVAAYTRSLEDDPGNLSDLKRRANALVMMGNHKEAEASLETAINAAESESDRTTLQITLAKVYLAHAQSLGRKPSDSLSEAEVSATRMEYLEKALETDRNNIFARNWLSRVGFSGAAEASRALEAYDPRDNPADAPDEALQQAGTYEYLNGDRPLGIRLLELSVQKNGNNHGALNNLAFALMETDSDRAVNLAKRAVGLDRNNPHYRETLGKIYMQQGQWAKASGELEDAAAVIQRFVEEMNKTFNDSPEVTSTQKIYLEKMSGLNLKVHEALVECAQQQGLVNRAASFQKKVDELRAN